MGAQGESVNKLLIICEKLDKEKLDRCCQRIIMKVRGCGIKFPKGQQDLVEEVNGRPRQCPIPALKN